MIRKEDLFFEIFKLMKIKNHPLTLKEIIDHLVKKGYKKTTCHSLFSPSVLQPLFFQQKKDYTEPMIIKVESLSARGTLFKLNKKWRQTTEHEIKNRFNFIN